ncbi:uncharacterized protein LOC111715550, partial [Eurytemora carolleeae]|uniref:uncharacterized protein LOC111715550 n=1 Tax=Eurytemora carolleeae TaxID=1294199 RepID=UPI000C75CD6C
MCAKPNDLVSDYILRDGIWMQNEVELLISLILDYPNSTFLDLGANLGTFSVAAAAFKHRVIAVDPFLLNHAYSRMSTFLFGSEENVRYLVNTISDGKEALYPFYRFPGNEGGISFINQETAKTKPANLIGEPVYPVTLKEILDSITTDTVIIKIDVEGSECVALTPYLTQPIKEFCTTNKFKTKNNDMS